MPHWTLIISLFNQVLRPCPHLSHALLLIAQAVSSHMPYHTIGPRVILVWLLGCQIKWCCMLVKMKKSRKNPGNRLRISSISLHLLLYNSSCTHNLLICPACLGEGPWAALFTRYISLNLNSNKWLAYALKQRQYDSLYGRFGKDKSLVFLVENYGSGATPWLHGIIFTQLRAIPLTMTENSIW